MTKRFLLNQQQLDKNEETLRLQSPGCAHQENTIVLLTIGSPPLTLQPPSTMQYFTSPRVCVRSSYRVFTRSQWRERASEWGQLFSMHFSAKTPFPAPPVLNDHILRFMAYPFYELSTYGSCTHGHRVFFVISSAVTSSKFMDSNLSSIVELHQ